MIESPIIYAGTKKKILNRLLSVFPEKCDIFVDLFCGTGAVGVNYQNSNLTILNDLDINLFNILELFKNVDANNLIEDSRNIIKKYDLSNSNKEGYLKYRAEVKRSYSPMDLFILMCFSFNNQLRFNNKGEFNVPFGRRKYNDRTEDKIIKFSNEISKSKYLITNKDFDLITSLSEMNINKDIFIYLDPPYHGSVAVYNSKWELKDELKMYDFLNRIDNLGIKFALSNNLQYNSQIEYITKKYNVHEINCDYKNCNYHRKEKIKPSQEVLITNY